MPVDDEHALQLATAALLLEVTRISYTFFFQQEPGKHQQYLKAWSQKTHLHIDIPWDSWKAWKYPVHIYHRAFP